jgi:hypothetical protein
VSYALGAVVPLEALVVDSDGDPANATTAALTITLPDGTSSAQSPSNPATGTYTCDYTPTSSGLHAVRWTFTGANASAPPLDSFYVEDPTVPPLMSLAEAREWCRVGSDDDDAHLAFIVEAASAMCEERTRAWRRRTITATLDGGVRSLRLIRPIASITSVTEDGTALTSADWILYAGAGRLDRGSSTFPKLWAYGQRNVVVTYVTGQSGEVPASVRHGVLLLVQHLWDAHRGGSGLPRLAGADFSYPTGFALPSAVRELWGPWMRRAVG